MTLVADWNSSVNVPFQRMRQQLLDGVLQEGVVGASDLMVVQRGAGVNQSVDVGTGFAWVKVDTGTRNGMGHVTNDATANVTLTAANGTNPRIDQIILRWNDSSIPTGSGNIPTLEVLTGTATAGATLDNRTNAATLPNDCLRLADVLVPTSSTTVSNTQIRDRRPWARGAHVSLIKSNADTATVSSASFVETDTTSAKVRIEASGVPLLIRVAGSGAGSAGTTIFAHAINGDIVGSSANSTRDRTLSVSGGNQLCELTWRLGPTAGSLLVSLVQRATAGNWKFLSGTAGGNFEFSVEELVRQNTANNTTTSG